MHEHPDESDKVNILLVDDQPAKLLTYETMLGSLGENLIKANSGREALEHLLHSEITVILMDVSMPDLDGFELAEIIRGHPRHQKTAIIFVSAVHLTDMDRLKGYESGAVDYVSVPVVPELLRAKVRVFTELYRKTRETERLTRELEQRVLERTAELEASMQRQYDLTAQLREADRRKDEFLALLAHELRNPLAPVRNAVSIMQMSEIADPRLRWCRDVIERQSMQLTRLVDDLLDVSRITHGKITLREEVVDLSTIVANALETCRPQIEAQGHEVRVSLPAGTCEITGDSMRLTQVVANLLNNAAKYQEPKGLIEIAAECDDDVAHIRVRDQGMGMTAETLDTVFDLFAQGERSADRTQGGLGVGLSLVRTLVRMHGGTVQAFSDGPGKGSEFVIALPVRNANAKAVPSADDDSVEAGSRVRRILIVDDNRDSAESMATLLRMHGHQVHVAYEGPTALDLARAHRPAVLLLDVGLPGMDGYEVCRRLREEGFVQTQVIAMTGFGQPRDMQRSRDVGFDAHAVKPLRIETLLGLLNGHPSDAVAAGT
jgi:signal transduction histidine kinase